MRGPSGLAFGRLAVAAAAIATPSAVASYRFVTVTQLLGYGLIYK